MLVLGSRKADVEGPRVLRTAGAGVGREKKLDSMEVNKVVSILELRMGNNSMSSAGDS